MQEKHDHGSSEEECDWEILKLANEKGKFGIELGVIPCEHIQAAFERGIDNNWWIMVDLTFLPSHPSRNPLRLFKLTNFGEARRATLQKKFDKPKTH